MGCVKPLILEKKMFTERHICWAISLCKYGLKDCMGLGFWGITETWNTASLPNWSIKKTYSFNAHAMKHVKYILCWNIARWTLCVGATTEACYCRVQHRDSHLWGQTRWTFSTSNQPSHHIKSRNNLVLFDCSVRCPASRQVCGHVLRLFRRIVGSAPEDEWAKKSSTVWLSHPLCQHSLLVPYNYGLVPKRGIL